MEIEPHAVEQSLRRSHCQRSGYEHQCTGKMTVTAAGIELACVLCGSTASPYIDPAVRTMTARLAQTLGLNWDALAPETQARALQLVSAMRGGLSERGWEVKR